MDIILGFAVSIFVFTLLLYAAIRDLQTGEVSNWVWITGLLVLPITIFRMVLYGAILLYIFQVVIVIVLVTIGFYVGLIGGADGKAILLVSLIYPWNVFSLVWIITAPFLVLVGGFCLLGVYSLFLSIRNVVIRRRLTSSQRESTKPTKKIFWLTRRFNPLNSMKNGTRWEPVTIALIAYFLITYVVLLILSSGYILMLN
ncbi:MAG: prepilin peptidase [Promethearchaeota archaeon]